MRSPSASPGYRPTRPHLWQEINEVGKHSKGNEESTSVEPRSGAHRKDGSGTRQLAEKYRTGWQPPKVATKIAGK